MKFTQEDLYRFLKESNAIEGILNSPTMSEMMLATCFLQLDTVLLADLKKLQMTIAPGRPFRDQPNMDVHIGGAPKQPPVGGPHIVELIENCLLVAHIEGADPWMIHCHLLDIHPFLDGNGRTSRLLWAWMMLRCGKKPFAFPFLQEFYYQTLGAVSLLVFNSKEMSSTV